MFDNLDLHNRYEREQEKQLERLPRCSDCGERIQEDWFYEINGEPICVNCMEAGYKKRIEDLLE